MHEKPSLVERPEIIFIQDLQGASRRTSRGDQPHRYASTAITNCASNPSSGKAGALRSDSHDSNGNTGRTLGASKAPRGIQPFLFSNLQNGQDAYRNFGRRSATSHLTPHSVVAPDLTQGMLMSPSITDIN
jgi:hypothetical protein